MDNFDNNCDKRYIKNSIINTFMDDKSRVNAKEYSGANFIKSIIEPDKRKKLSVVGNYIGLNGDIDTTSTTAIPNNEYYGLSPIIDGNVIMQAMKQGCFNDIVSLKKYMAENCGISGEKVFCLREEHSAIFPSNIESVKKALFAKTLIRMTMHFGMRIFTGEYSAEVDKIVCDMDKLSIGEKFISGIDYAYIPNMQDKTKSKFRILGVPSQAFFNFLLNRIGVCKNINGEFVFCNVADSIIKSRENYLENIHGLGTCYYSGVLPKVLHISAKNTKMTNINIDVVQIDFCKTTFATLDAMDNSFVKKHHLLQDKIDETSTYAEVISSVDEYELSIQKKYIFDNTDEEATNENINIFLRNSFNSNTIAVTADITTEDNYHLFVERSSQSIDSNTIYTSANGQSEIVDKNVYFYYESIFEDYPTLDIDSKKRIDFNEEFERETYAELGVNTNSKEWKYLAVTVLGIKSNEGDDTGHMRLHFNILAKNNTDNSLLTIFDKIKTATENFESKALYGLKINVDNDRKSRSKRYFDNFAHMFKYCDKVTLSLISLITLIMSLSTFNEPDTGFSFAAKIITAVISMTSLILLFINFGFMFGKFLRRKKVSKNLSFMRAKNIENYYDNARDTANTNKLLSSADHFFASKKTKLHPISIMMLCSIYNSECKEK